jgi:hypothetical protein
VISVRTQWVEGNYSNGVIMTIKNGTLAALARAILPILCPVLFAGCDTHPHSGHIYVDHPAVFTRERLVNRRLDEQTWLETQLKTDAPYSVQGSIDTRDFEGVAAAVSANFDPLGGAQTQSAIQSVQQNSRVGDLQNQLQVAVLKKQVQMVQNWTNGNVPAPQFPTNGAASGGGGGSNVMVSNPITLNFGPFATNLPPLPNPSGRVLSTSQLTSIQSLDDQLARRNYLQSLLREQELDDTHDLAGMTLYTLKFDISVMPGEKNPSFGQVSLFLPKGTNEVPLPTPAEYTNWVYSLNHELIEQCMGLERRFYMNYLSDSEVDELVRLVDEGTVELEEQLMNSATRANCARTPATVLSAWPEYTSALTNYIAFHSSDAETKIVWHVKNLQMTDPVAAADVPSELTDFVTASKYKGWLFGLRTYLQTGVPGVDGAHALEYLVQKRYEAVFSNEVSIADAAAQIRTETNQLVKIGTNNYFICTAAVRPDGWANLSNALYGISTDFQPRVTVVEPKEYAQNLSDVAARQRVLSLAASVSALIPQAATSVSLSGQYVKESQQMFDTIKRQPLVVGYANGDSEFGWVLGPKFGFDEDGKLLFTQTPIQYSVEASVIVPGWWSILQLKATNGWLSDQGEKDYVSDEATFTARLPQDYAAITRALLAQSDESLLQPTIQPRWDPSPSRQKIVVQQDQPADLLIRGSDLWRNPKVLIGAQTADAVNVLPDMAGLLAHFDNITLPASPLPGPQLADLTVITSGGMASLRDGVQILPAESQNPQAFAALQSTYVTNGGTLSFAIDANLMPKSFGQLKLLVTDPRDNSTLFPYLITNNFPSSGSWSVPLPAGMFGGDSRPLNVDLELGQTPDPHETLVSVLKNKPVSMVYFASPTNVQLLLTPPTVYSTTNNVSATNIVFTLSVQADTNLFKAAFPQFEPALNGTGAALVLSNGTISASGPLSGSLTKAIATVTFRYATNLPNAQIWVPIVTYPNGGLFMVNTNVSVTWGP